MCGRFALNYVLAVLRRVARVQNVRENGLDFSPSNNIAPGETIPAISDNTIDLMKWGITSSKISTLIFNVRSETAPEKFSSDISIRRCVIPAEGYFEWDAEHHPFFFYKKNKELMFLASFYTLNNQCTILTRSAIDKFTLIHPRMPIILSFDQIALWLSPNWRMLLTSEVPTILFHPVSSLALKPGSKGPECIQPIRDPKKNQKTLDSLIKTTKKTVLDIIQKEAMISPPTSLKENK